MGRPPDGDHAMTDAERQRKRRQRQQREQDKIKNGGNVTPSGRFDAAALQQCYQLEPGKKPLKMPSLERCQQDAGHILKHMVFAEQYKTFIEKVNKHYYETIVKPSKRLLRGLAVSRRPHERELSRTPALENVVRAELEELDGIERSLRSLIARHETALLGVPDWSDLARVIAHLAKEALGEVSKPPKSVSNPDDPLCIIVTNVLKCLGYSYSRSAVSATLQGRRGRLSKAIRQELRTNPVPKVSVQD